MLCFAVCIPGSSLKFPQGQIQTVWFYHMTRYLWEQDCGLYSPMKNKLFYVPFLHSVSNLNTYKILKSAIKSNSFQRLFRKDLKEDNRSDTKLPCQKPMLRQIEWGVQNRHIRKNLIFNTCFIFFWKFCFSIRTSYKELIWCTNISLMFWGQF